MSVQASGLGTKAEAFNDWMIDKTGARWQFWVAAGFVLGFCTAVSL